MTQNWAAAYVIIALVGVLNVCASVYAVFRDRRAREEGAAIEMTTYDSHWFPWRIPEDELSRSSSAV